MEPDTIDPQHFPTVTLGGQTYTPKLTAGSIIRLARAGFDVDALRKANVQGAEAVERLAALLHATIPELSAKTIEQVADLIELAQIPALSAALNEAIKKALPQATMTPAKTDTPAVQ